MANPRELIFAAITAQIEKIRQENGYYTDVGTVYRVEMTADAIPEGAFPAVFVLDSLAGGELTPIDAEGYQLRLPIGIAAITKSGTSDLTSSARHTEINNLIHDIWRVLLEDPTFGGACKDSFMSDGPTFVDTERGEALYNCNIVVNLFFQRSDL